MRRFCENTSEIVSTFTRPHRRQGRQPLSWNSVCKYVKHGIVAHGGDEKVTCGVGKQLAI